MSEIKELEETNSRQAQGDQMEVNDPVVGTFLELSEQAKEAPERDRNSPVRENLVRRGRPPGAKNKDTLFKELMTGNFQSKAISDIEKVYEVLFKRAHEGDMKAIKMVLDRVVPVTKAVDADQIKGGVSISINVGSLEAAQAITVEEMEDGEWEEA